MLLYSHILPDLGVRTCFPRAMKLEVLLHIGVLPSDATWPCSITSSPLVYVKAFGLSKPMLARISLYMLPLLLIFGSSCVSQIIFGYPLEFGCNISASGYELPMSSMSLLGEEPTHLPSLWALSLVQPLFGSAPHTCMFVMLRSLCGGLATSFPLHLLVLVF